MGTDLHLSCSCGELAAVVSDVAPDRANRVVCGCRFCQAAAHELGHPEILDALGGTERFQVSPRCFVIRRGQLDSLQLTKGGGLRWHASCCRTPVALTLPSANVPFLGLESHCVRPRQALDAAVGPVRARVNTHLTRAERRKQKATFGDLLRMLAHLTPLMTRWWWRGDHRRSDLFDQVRARGSRPRRLRATSGCG